MNKISNRNLIILLTYILILSVVLIGYLFMVAYQREGYDPQVYNSAYLYFVILQFVFFTIFLPLWDDVNIKIGNTKNEFLSIYISMLLEVIIFSLASIPHILTIFILGHLKGINFILPLIIQIFWGMVLLSLREYLNIKYKIKNLKSFILILFIFTLIILSTVFLYFYIEYKSLVVITLYNEGFPGIFFINPLLAIGGLLYSQIGGGNYLGNSPLIINILFSIFITIIFNILRVREIFKTGVNEYEKKENNTGIKEA
ncbi:hypothetical protein [Maledivibacter halophilus]|uniref:Uncharacterized protein n=1 Tax=Maledivibacter halophilus TaxID=36842 RepID=A0A1T5J3J0_9FIRM|nr:hypothetical protein [Maledivibacter halophilus]SKC45758.1 hypothetical protein SAMN02194393_00877 [Maledivibacter halophilus]